MRNHLIEFAKRLREASSDTTSKDYEVETITKPITPDYEVKYRILGESSYRYGLGFSEDYYAEIAKYVRILVKEHLFSRPIEVVLINNIIVYTHEDGLVKELQ